MTPSTDVMDTKRRFGGVARLYGDAGLNTLQHSHICVIGIGGVGSWAAEALARNAVGKITLIDLDNIAESNVNRQLHAVDGVFGQAKVTAMAARLLSINPSLEVVTIEDFVTPDNVGDMLVGAIDGVIDCMDDAKAKMAVAAFCHHANIPLVMVGGAGGRLDPTRIHSADLSAVQHDKLLAKVRNGLRRDYGFAKGRDGVNQKQPLMHVPCVFSDELVFKPDNSCATSDSDTQSTDAITGLNCAGYGSSVCVTAPFGFAAVALLFKRLIHECEGI